MEHMSINTWVILTVARIYSYIPPIYSPITPAYIYIYTTVCMLIWPFLPLFCNCRRADVEAGAGAGGTASGAATGGAGGLGEER